MAELLLKARPTAAQLADRLRLPAPDGLELYLDLADVATETAMEEAICTVQRAVPTGCTLLVEGPVRSLDGSFFETSRDSAADRELVRRLVALSRRLGARAINLHLIQPRAGFGALSLEQREQALAACLPFTRFFVEQVRTAGMIPTLENMPPVLRMREGGFYASVIGMPAEDLLWLVERVPGLRLCLDLSHAQLFVNACRLGQRLRLPPRYAPLLRFVRRLPGVSSVGEYAERLGPALLTVHVANASGMLGEGRSYNRGDLDLDALLPRLAAQAEYLVTETLERRPERARLMRQALRRMRAALAATPGRSRSVEQVWGG